MPSNWLSRRLEERRIQKLYRRLRRAVFGLVPREEVEKEARLCGYTKREHQQKIAPFEFVLCTALASMVEAKRGFAPVWRLLVAAADIKLARSAVTQRFSTATATLLQTLFERAVERLPEAERDELLAKLDTFEQVLADDGSVLKLCPLLSKLFPATRTNNMQAAAKVHAQADVRSWHILRVEVTGERDSELAVVQAEQVRANVLYLRDLGYTSYDELKRIKEADGHVLMRIKTNANPVVEHVRHGILGPRASEGMKLSELRFPRSVHTFDLDARFSTKSGSVILRVVGHYNPDTGEYHRYVTTLPPEHFTVTELESLYGLRWVIELLFKVLKSSCHLDHLNTKKPEAVRTHIYASLLAATVLSALVLTAAQVAGIPAREISMLTVGIAAPLLVIPLLLLWLDREITHDELAEMVIRTIVVGCVDQNPARTKRKWGKLS